MLFISLPMFIFLFVFSTGLSLGMGITAYRFFITENKISAENFLFISICSVVILCLCFASVIIYSRQRRSALYRINKLVHINSAAAIKRFDEFGKLGKFFQSFFKNILDISERRGERIVFLDQALRLICGQTSESLLIVNDLGEIKYATKGVEKNNSSEQGIQGVQFGDLFPEIAYSDIFTTVSYSRTEHTEKGEKHIFRFFPVCEKNNNVRGLFVIIAKNTVISSSGNTVKQLYESVTGRDKTDTENRTDKSHTPQTLKKSFLSFLKNDKKNSKNSTKP